jgi:HK97 family phage prohead protease
MSTTETAPEMRRVFLAPIEGMEWRKAENGRSDDMTVAGHAAVFNRLSHDLGGFREKIKADAFNAVLDGNPDVHLLWDHSTLHTLARTANKTLDLRIDPKGLHFWARVAPTSYAADLRVLMERGDIDQASFAFIVGDDEWLIDEEENVTRTITRVSDLFDVTITAQGAYPQTDASLRSVLQDAISRGRLPDLSVARAVELAADPVRAEEDEDSPQEPLAESEENVAAQEDPAADGQDALQTLKTASAEAKQRAREDLIRLTKDMLHDERNQTGGRGAGSV